MKTRRFPLIAAVLTMIVFTTGASSQAQTGPIPLLSAEQGQSVQQQLNALRSQVAALQASNAALRGQVNTLQASATGVQNQLANAKNVAALNAIRALKELHRNRVAIVTFDLDLEIATYMANGEFVKAMSTQRPYEQGVAVGLATAKALLGDEQHKYIGVSPCVVEPRNLDRAWKEILHERMPNLPEAALENLRK